VLKTALGGVAVAFPVVGVPALAAVVTANQALNAADKLPKAKAQLAQAIASTRVLASKGDPAAKRALNTFQLVASAKAGKPAAVKTINELERRYHVGNAIRNRHRLHNNGRITRV